MGWETHPVTPDRFEDFADVLNRSRRVNHCWCLSHRLQAAEIERLGGGSRDLAMRRLCEREHPPGVVTYLDGEPIGWCNIGPRAEITRLGRPDLSGRKEERRWPGLCNSASTRSTLNG